MKSLTPIWFMEEPIDLEHKQYLILGFIKKANDNFKADIIDPYLFDVKYHMGNLECFITTRCLLPPKGREINDMEDERLKWFDKLSEESKEVKEIMEIAKWAHKKLQASYKKGAESWKTIEASLKMFFIGDIPTTIEKGYIFIRYGGSSIVEVWEFYYDNKKKSLDIKLHSYKDMGGKSDYGDVKFELGIESEMISPAFIGIESSRIFDTKKSVLPVVKTIISGQVLTNKIWSL